MQADEEYVVSLWQHEVTRVIKDRICRSLDIKWFEKTLKTIIKEVQLQKSCFDGLSSLLCTEQISLFFLFCFRTFQSFLPILRLLCLLLFHWMQDFTLNALWLRDVLRQRFVVEKISK